MKFWKLTDANLSLQVFRRRLEEILVIKAPSCNLLKDPNQDFVVAVYRSFEKHYYKLEEKILDKVGSSYLAKN